jgi:PAS domain S-box-containing protein
MNQPKGTIPEFTPLNGEGQCSPLKQSNADTWLDRSGKSDLRFLNTNTGRGFILITLFTLFAIGSLALFQYFSSLSNALIQSLAIEESKSYSTAISEFRNLYTSEVVSRVVGHGIAISHNYVNQEAAIPLPATLTMLLGDRLERAQRGVKIRLFSNYPFSWRSNGGPQDAFEREAILQITADPTQPYYRIESLQGQEVLRFATADLMKEACVDCHNQHPDTPKTGWKVGDVRGILEVIQPISQAVIQTRTTLWETFIIILLLVGVGIGAVVFVIMKLRHNTIELEKKVQERTRNLIQSNQELDQLMGEHKAAETKLRTVLESAPEAIIMTDDTGQIVLVNAQTEHLFGYAREEMLGQSIEMLVPESQRQVHQAKRMVYEDNPHAQAKMMEQGREVIARRKDGGTCPVEIGLAPIETQEGMLILATIRDITERKRMEVELVLAQKMESIGQLAAGIAHEINTPTQFLGDNLRFLQESFGAVQKVMDVYGRVIQTMPRDTVDPQLLQAMDTIVAEADLEYVTTEILKALEQSLDGTERVGNIVRAMKDFSHPGTGEKKSVDLNRAIESTTTVARNEWKYVADLVLNLDPTLPPIPCFPGEFNQVILNLIVNAAHAISDAIGKEVEQKGTITIGTRVEGEWVEVRITDTGTGIPEPARDKIFDPFFTSKEVGKGTGQGLAMAHDVIVKKHGGRLTFETEVGTGTTFIIQLPYQATAVMGGSLNGNG